MSRPLIVDTVPFHDELDILECRLTELYDVVDWFVVVEADVTHQDNPKPSYLSDHWERFAPFHDKIVKVWATGLPTIAEDPDPWARERSQREHAIAGLRDIPDELNSDTIILHGDVDEIPTRLVARNIRPGRQLVGFEQIGLFWAVDWKYPLPWYGTVATTVSRLERERFPFNTMRDARNLGAYKMPNGGWHLSWLGGRDRALKKLGAFCHPEVADRIHGAIIDDEMFYWREGWHVDGQKLEPVDVDGTWPRWIADGNAPASWYRPRDGKRIDNPSPPVKMV